MRKVFPVFSIILGLFWIAMSFKYGLWVRRGPGGGFFPFIGGTLTLVFSAFYLKDEIKASLPSEFNWKFLHPILAALGILICSYAVGFVPALFLYLFLWLWRYEKFAPAKSLWISAGTILGLYVVFVFWLSVPLPRGMLGEIIFG